MDINCKRDDGDDDEPKEWIWIDDCEGSVQRICDAYYVYYY